MEIVAKETEPAVYLRDNIDKPVDATASTRSGVDGNPQRIEMKPGSGKRLSATSLVT